MTKSITGRMTGGVALLGATGLLVAATMLHTGTATAAPAPPAGDPVKGKVTFAKCAICHAVEPGKNKLGPSLAGVVGRKPATVAGFAYSPAMKANVKPWTVAQLDAFLTNPRATVPGTKMIFAGLPQPADRANVIAYLSNPAAVK